MYKIKILMLLLLGLLIYSCQNNDVVKSKDEEIETKVSDLLSQMTIEEKIGQMTQIDFEAFTDFNDITKYSIGSVLWGGNSEIDDLSPKGWAKIADSLVSFSVKSRLGIPIILGIDAVHGHNNVDGAVVFPHNVGLGCTRNPELIEQASKAIASEISATNIHWTFAPCVAVARNEKWGRSYESFSEDPELVASLGASAVRGFEGIDLSNEGTVLSCTKHYMGDGGTTNGKDQGNTECDEETLRKIHLPGYISAIKENTATIMASYNSWNGEKLHAHKHLLTDVLKNELGFKGFVVSDWAAIDQIEGDYKTDIEKCINAGIDMVMIPNGPALQDKIGDNGQKVNTYNDFLKLTKELVDEGKISKERIDDAVTRILRAKFRFDLFNKVKKHNLSAEIVGSKENREIARKCVQQSLVLLKNENKVLPISKEIKNIHITGNGSDNIGMQCGGWTISWQGGQNNIISGGTSILNAVKNSVDKNTVVTNSLDGTGGENADLIIVVVGEIPYAEMFGDKSDLSLSKEDLDVIEKVKSQNKPMVVVLLSGRPMIINSTLEKADAFVAAWLPGTEGQGIADVLFGDVNFSGKLSYTWPKSMEDIPINVGDKNYNPLFEYGYGLKY